MKIGICLINLVVLAIIHIVKGFGLKVMYIEIVHTHI